HLLQAHARLEFEVGYCLRPGVAVGVRGVADVVRHAGDRAPRLRLIDQRLHELARRHAGELALALIRHLAGLAIDRGGLEQPAVAGEGEVQRVGLVEMVRGPLHPHEPGVRRLDPLSAGVVLDGDLDKVLEPVRAHHAPRVVHRQGRDVVQGEARRTVQRVGEDAQALAVRRVRHQAQVEDHSHALRARTWTVPDVPSRRTRRETTERDCPAGMVGSRAKPPGPVSRLPLTSVAPSRSNGSVVAVRQARIDAQSTYRPWLGPDVVMRLIHRPLATSVRRIPDSCPPAPNSASRIGALPPPRAVESVCQDSLSSSTGEVIVEVRWSFQNGSVSSNTSVTRAVLGSSISRSTETVDRPSAWSVCPPIVRVRRTRRYRTLARPRSRCMLATSWS